MTCLTSRQLEIASLVGKAKSNKSIGKLLEISADSVHTSLTACYRKLNLAALDHPRVGLALWHQAQAA